MDLDIRRVLAARPTGPVRQKLNKLVTPWGEDVDRACPRAEHPRPLLERSSWTCLNGPWDYAIRESGAADVLWRSTRPPRTWDGTILVPFSPETTLSGVGRQLTPCELLWYRRSFEVGGSRERRRVLLHFDAVDYACRCLVNGVEMGAHVGGYLPFDLDITEALRAGENTVELCVYDPSEQGTQLRGKQRLRRGNIWYTAQSGIWQTVWLEEVPETHIASLAVHADPDARRLDIELEVRGRACAAVAPLVQLIDADRRAVASSECLPGGAGEPDAEGVRLHLALTDLDGLRLWEPDDPYLYGVRVACGEDEVSSYCAFRTVGVEPDGDGTPRFCLNHRPLFVRGVLDQGYWPDGLMTAPSDEAMVADIEAARSMGFNMLRKHIKVEPERWYWHCDRLGMLVSQDMVSGGGIAGEWPSANIPTLVRRSWSSLRDTAPRVWRRLGAGDGAYREEWRATARAVVARLAAHPSICWWVAFNESWGQFSSAAMCEELRGVDRTRPFVATSGWYDQGAGDFFAVHNYFRGMRVYRDPHAGAFGRKAPRAFLLNEFGGLVCPVAGHVSVPTAYGYDSYDDPREWKAAVDTLLASVDALEADGLSGFVYTQLTDVEEEANGLMTYDRRPKA